MAKLKVKKVLKNCNYDAQRYCIDKNILIYPVLSGSGYKVMYEYGKLKEYEQGKVFQEKDVFQAIWDLYDKIYQYDKKRGKV